MKVVQRRKSVQEVKPRITMWVPAWVIKELGFELGDESEWVPLEDDNGERLVALRRIPGKKEGEGEEEEKKEEEDYSKGSGNESMIKEERKGNGS